MLYQVRTQEKDTVGILDDLEFLAPGFHVLDVGAGLGMLANHLARRHTFYTGLEVRRPLVEVFKAHSWRQIMKHINVYSKVYNPLGILRPDKVRFPVETASIDTVVCHSLFTHLGTEAVASRYMKEIHRVLKPGGNLWTSWFLDPPNEENMGEKRTVYRKAFVEKLLRGFHKVHESGGLTTMFHDQIYYGHKL